MKVGIGEHHKILLVYSDASEQMTQRTVRPLGCFYWGKVWTLAAWCETRNGFRSFRMDRMVQVQRLDGIAGQFTDESGKTLADYLRAVAPSPLCQYDVQRCYHRN